jgi:sigma-E factor negative regulatory protein RseB
VTRRRLSCGAVAVAGLLLVGLPTLAHARSATGPVRSADERAATALLERAVTAGRRLEYRGTQHVTVWRDGVAHRTSAELAHDPATGSVVRGRGAHPEADGDTAVLDPRVLDRLAAAYALSVRGPVPCAGRTASLVEARRGDGAVAGRLWVDRDSGLLLRREVYDAAGRRARSTALVDLDVAPVGDADRRAARHGGPRGDRAGTLERLRRRGWPVAERLPGGFRLLEARGTSPVLQLAYTDGLSTLSVFVQPGGLDAARLEGFAQQGRRVARHGPADRPGAGGVVGRPARLHRCERRTEPAVMASWPRLPHEADDGGLLGPAERGTARCRPCSTRWTESPPEAGSPVPAGPDGDFTPPGED